MKFIIALFLTALLIYLLSFAVFNWKNKNRLAAVGAVIIAFAAFGFGIYVAFFGKYEL